jgi:hypothetical protein
MGGANSYLTLVKVPQNVQPGIQIAVAYVPWGADIDSRNAPPSSIRHLRRRLWVPEMVSWLFTQRFGTHE